MVSTIVTTFASVKQVLICVFAGIFEVFLGKDRLRGSSPRQPTTFSFNHLGKIIIKVTTLGHNKSTELSLCQSRLMVLFFWP
jgi:hypothetical protein